ncbi:MAG: ABC transporter permease [Planctomycetota bacterium]|nr:MAG: ABC transporter permease [Planctomycetota bacterium]REK22564.1 MAG: ABC transporter permease [Planctomycetota bacterium]REK36014.1 MAG: ABC transporter permease [Planctomycetota bacterium]
MLHGALALLSRSLREGARFRRAHAFRIISLLIVLGMLAAAQAGAGSVGAPGLRFFELICFLIVALITLAGFSFFATPISEEKDDGTLALLKLADLSPLSMLLGKSTSRLAAALLLFVGLFPFSLLAVTLGGVTVHQVWSAFVALAAYMVLVANVGLLCSVISPNSRAAAALMFLITLLFLGLVPLLHSSYGLYRWDDSRTLIGDLAVACRPVVGFVHDASVIVRLQSILATGFDASAVSVQVLASLGGGAACFAAAWLLFDRCTETAVSGRPFRSGPTGTSARFFRVPRLVWRVWRWPLVWKDYHFIAGGPLITAMKLVLYPALIVLIIWQEDWLFALFYVSSFDAAWGATAVIAVCELIYYASSMFQHERRAGALPTLVLLPYSTWTLTAAKATGCLLGGIPTALLIGFLSVVLVDDSLAANPWRVEGIVALLVLLAVLLQITALNSLVVRWGAAPLAVAILLIAGGCLLPALGAIMALLAEPDASEYAELVPVLYAGGVLTVILQFLIGNRLRAAAAA